MLLLHQSQCLTLQLDVLEEVFIIVASPFCRLLLCLILVCFIPPFLHLNCQDTHILLV